MTKKAEKAEVVVMGAGPGGYQAPLCAGRKGEGGLHSTAFVPVSAGPAGGLGAGEDSPAAGRGDRGGIGLYSSRYWFPYLAGGLTFWP